MAQRAFSHSLAATVPPLEPSISVPAGASFTLDHELGFRSGLTPVFRELREILHRRGRFSARNEALDELSKLLFAHLMSANATGGGLRRAIESAAQQGIGPAAAVRHFTRQMFTEFLPQTLTEEMEISDFDLRIKPNEDELAQEIVDCFAALDEAIARSDGLRYAPGGIRTGLDVLNEAFGSFLADSFVDEKQLGQYLTPQEVVRFMVHLALQGLDLEEIEQLSDPDSCHEFGLILDPSCGVGSFLTELLHVLRSGPVGALNAHTIWKWTRRMTTEVLTGIDKSERMIRLALTSMAMFGFPAARLHQANALARSGHDAEVTAQLEGKAGLILTNPPFGAEFNGENLARYRIATDWASKPPRTVASEILFLERYADWLRPRGHLVAVVPDSVLTNRGIFSDLRRALSHEIEIRAVVSLPTVTFASAGTSTKTSVLYCRKRDPLVSGRRPAYFAICDDLGFQVVTRGSNRAKVPTNTSQLPEVLAGFSGERSCLTKAKWVDSAEAAARWDANYHASLPGHVQSRLSDISEADVQLREVAYLSSERVDPIRLESDSFDYIEISDIEPRSQTVNSKRVSRSNAPSRARKRVHAGDVLLSTVRPDRKTIGVVPSELDGAVCTTGFAVIRPAGIDPKVLAALLSTDFVTDQLMRHNLGIAYPAIEESCLLDVLLPIRQEVLDRLRAKARTLDALEQELRSARADFGSDLQAAIDEWMRSEA